MSAKATIGVLALQGDVVDHEAMAQAAGARTVKVRRQSELDGLDGLIIPGGESTAMSNLLNVFDLFDPIATVLSQGMPVYGSCAGMIMLADKVLDGRSDQRSFGVLDITVRRNAFGRQVDSFEADIAIKDLTGDPFRCVFIRAPWVESMGESVQVLGQIESVASSSDSVDGSAQSGGVGRVVAVRGNNALATSFHPEITGDIRIHQYFLDMVRSIDREQA